MSPFWIRYTKAQHRFRWLLCFGAIALTIVTAMSVRHLSIKSDFKRMLPQDYPSVVQLERIEERVRSTASLLLLVGGDDWPAMRRFIDDFVAAVPTELSDLVDRVEYNGKAVGNFFDKNKYLYVDIEDLEEIYDRLKKQIDYEKIRKSPLYIEFDEPKKFSIEDIEEKYSRNISQYKNYQDGYFTNNDATLAIVVLKPKQGATDVQFAKYLIGRVNTVVDAMHPGQYHPSLKVGIGGRYPKLITEFETILGDMQRTIILCALLVGGIVFFYFRRLRMGFLMLGAAGLGTLTSLTVARFAIGYLTAQTAFLGSIILGNGINYSLIFMARYLEERREHHLGPQEALATALEHTWRPTLASSLTTAASFAALAFAEVRGFSQFGFIGGFGMLACWFFTYTLLPGWLLVSEQLRPLTFPASRNQAFGHVMRPLGDWLIKHFARILKWSVALIAVACVVAGVYIPNSLEYDFSRLRFKPSEPKATWEHEARGEADEIFGKSASPAIIVADRLDQVRDICDTIERKAKHIYTQEGKPILDECRSLLTYVPLDQAPKLAVLTRMRKLIADSPLEFLSDDQRTEIETFQKTFDLQPVALEDLPETIVDNFRESDGREGLVIYVYPAPGTNLWDGRELVHFASLVREIPLPNGETIYASGEAAIFSDLLQTVIRQGPLITFLSFLLVVILVWISFRKFHMVCTVILTLSLGILWMVALLPLAGVKINFLNLVAFPIAFGIGVDYAVNIYQRYLQDGPGSIRDVLHHVGGAILLCSLTTISGYSVLMISRNMALQSFGLAGLLAEIACLGAAVIVLPAYITWKEREQKQ